MGSAHYGALYNNLALSITGITAVVFEWAMLPYLYREVVTIWINTLNTSQKALSRGWNTVNGNILVT
jgi:hypothetical protein